MIDIARLERILSRRTVAPDRETLVTRSAHLGQAMRTIGTYYPELWNGVDRDGDRRRIAARLLYWRWRAVLRGEHGQRVVVQQRREVPA